MWNVLKRTFGIVGHQKTIIKTMFGDDVQPPQMITINTDYNKQEQVPWGTFALPFLPGVLFETKMARSDEMGVLFRLVATGPKKYRYEVEGIFKLIEAELHERSLYRGKAFDGQEEPEFMDLSAVDPAKVIYSEEVTTQLEANIWAQLRHTDEFERLGIPLKRAVLVHGPYGSGKTLAAGLTAREAVENGWTFIKARPGRDDLATVLATARLYQPAVVFYEDVDQIAAPQAGDHAGIARLLDDFDGISAKGTKILCVLTTNHAERIHKGMVRPGRLDAMIEINDLDLNGVKLLVLSRIPDVQLEDDIDWEAVFAAATDYKPAFVTEAADRSMRYLLARHGGKLNGEKIGTGDLIASFNGLRPQHDHMTGARDTPEREPLSDVLQREVRAAVLPHIALQYNDEDTLVQIDP
jgi:transitional endoplasmic reticulum ATPase